ncbi:hypothetical protein THRCLA_06624 [Thraustotheca clavata]|uniref:COMM domain-containing protein n=1 Tax=Thraustotheca clavata TaxID=74557 RepID=A0A1V9ZLY3_9STRA|nr:hypothetical protein THRCLA_06624 [Thraustotheca clavata]
MIYDQSSIIADHIVSLMNFIQRGEDTAVRAMACQALALLIEYKYNIAQSSWSYDKESSSSPISGLIPKIQSFMQESGKTIGKKNRKTQRSTFKEVLETLATGQGPQDRDIQLEDEIVEVNSWARTIQSDVFRRVLSTGFQVHLSHNDVLREIFQVQNRAQVRNSMLSIADKRAGNKTKARSLRASIAIRRRAQNSFLYTEFFEMDKAIADLAAIHSSVGTSAITAALKDEAYAQDSTLLNALDHVRKCVDEDPAKAIKIISKANPPSTLTLALLNEATERDGKKALNTPGLPHLHRLDWRVDITIATNSIAPIWKPSVLLRFQLSDGAIHTVELPLKAFHQLRYNTAKILQEMNQLERHPIMRLTRDGRTMD